MLLSKVCFSSDDVALSRQHAAQKEMSLYKRHDREKMRQWTILFMKMASKLLNLFGA